MLYVLLLFLIAQFAGLALTFFSVSPGYIQPISSTSQSSNPVTFILYLIVNIIVAVLIIMLILRYYRGDLFFKLLEAYVILFGSFFLFFILIGDIYPPLNVVVQAAISLLLSLAILFYKNRTNRHRNMITLITCIGAGIFIGISIAESFGFLILYLFLAFFAAYDYLAVFVLKFMVPFAQEAVKRNLAFMVGSADIELLPPSPGQKKHALKPADLERIKDQRVKSLIKSGNVPVVSSVMLGNGDIILPLMLVTGAYALYGSFLLSLSIILGSATGLIFTMFLLRKYRVGLPAIPPLFAFVSLALVVFSLVSTPVNYLNIAVFSTASILSIAALVITLNRLKASGSLVSPSPSR